MACRKLGGLLAAAVLCSTTAAQEALEGLPGYERYQLVTEALKDLRATGRVSELTWDDDGAWLEFDRGEERLRFDLEQRTLEVLPAEPDEEEEEQQARRRRGPGRGRQHDRAKSPDEQWIARCVDYNVILERADDTRTYPVTRDGSRKLRYGTASWVYGEELNQNTAMWWSPDSRRLAFYEFDESEVPDFHLLKGWTERRTELLVEGYPKPGEPNPVARLLVYDLQTRQLTPIDVGSDPEQYVFQVRFSPAGDQVLFNRTNRHQNLLELVAADPVTGTSRVVVSEAQRTWQRNRPRIRFLADGVRFVWESEKTGWRHYELRHLDGHLIAPLTEGRYPDGAITGVDEESGYLYYMSTGDEHPLHHHLYRIRLDGTGQERLTSEPGHHTVRLSPDARWYVDTVESLQKPPVTAIYSTDGERIETLAEPETGAMAELGLEPAELFSFKADDGTTDLYGLLYKPTDFDPQRRYPLVVDVYGGPQSRRVYDMWRGPNAFCEFGFLIAVIDNRGTRGRGKAFEEAVYLQLGTVDLRDQVDGVRHLAQRPYVDSGRVGIFGGSYGGYMAALALLKQPDVFHVAVATSPVTDWRNYDTIYTERYMRTPQENPNGYDAGSCLTHADRYSGRLLLMHGMVDDNVHPNNAWQLVDALQAEGRDFEMIFYPTRGHGLGRRALGPRWRFLHRHLIGEPPPPVTAERPAVDGQG
jgi:dipeptidyl-peptidase-4